MIWTKFRSSTNILKILKKTISLWQASELFFTLVFTGRQRQFHKTFFRILVSSFSHIIFLRKIPLMFLSTKISITMVIKYLNQHSKSVVFLVLQVSAHSSNYLQEEMRQLSMSHAKNFLFFLKFLNISKYLVSVGNMPCSTVVASQPNSGKKIYSSIGTNLFSLCNAIFTH